MTARARATAPTGVSSFMRFLFATAVAIAPLVIASGAAAQVVVSSPRTTPIATSNPAGGEADDVRIASGGSITLRSGAAVTLNSDNDVQLDADGSILMTESEDGATGILAVGGNTGDITVGGAIRLTGKLTEQQDEDDDGDLDGPFADDLTRYGLRVTGDADLVGDIEIRQTGIIEVRGRESSAVFVESGLDGDLRTFGNLLAVGEGAAGVRATGDITGEVFLSGDITARGEDALGASFEGDIGGRLTVQSAIVATGFRSTSAPTSREALDALDEDDLLVGGPALRIAGNVEGGVLLGAPPPPAQNDDDDDDGEVNFDRDGNGVPDAQERTATITSFGSAPAVEIGSTERDVALGLIGEGDEAYGFINRGSIRAAGVFEGFAATALRIGADGDHGVDIAGGVRNEGSIQAESLEDRATAVSIGRGAVLPAFVNTGEILSTAVTDGDQGATSVLISEGASVARLHNQRGFISARVAGETADAVAIRDESGALGEIVNEGRITALIVRTVGDGQTGDEPITGRTIAIDVSRNTSGVTLIQDGIAFDDDGDPDTPSPPDADGDGVADAAEPIITGDILLGSGADIVDIRNGTVTGAIDFGTGQDTLLISGGARVTGALASGDGLLDIDVSNGVLDARQTQTIDVTGLTVGSDGNLILTVDPENGARGGFRVNGVASFADGAGLGLQFASLLDGPERFVVVEADTLVMGDLDTDSLQRNSPYLFVTEAGTDQAAGQIYIDARRRNGEEIGFIAAENAAYDAVYDALRSDEELRNAFLAQIEREGFVGLYEQMLPDHSGGPLLSLASGVDAVTRALTGRNDTAAPGQTSAWLQEINFYADKDRRDAYGFQSEGFGVAGGIERGADIGAFGLSVAFTSSDLEDPSSQAEEVLSANLLELGLYYRAQAQGWNVWGRAAAGYAWFDARRSFVGAGVFRRNESDWNGYSLAAAAGVNHERRFGRYSLRPEAIVEYFSLNEDGRIEEGGGEGFDLIIDDRSGHMFSATAAVSVGVGFGEDYWFRPELRLGWKQNISFDAGETVSRFSSGDAPFTLVGDTIEGGGPILGFRLNLGNELGMLSIEGDAELIDDYVRYALLLRASFRF